MNYSIVDKRTPSLREKVLGVDTTGPAVARVSTVGGTERTFIRHIYSSRNSFGYSPGPVQAYCTNSGGSENQYDLPTFIERG